MCRFLACWYNDNVLKLRFLLTLIQIYQKCNQYQCLDTLVQYVCSIYVSTSFINRIKDDNINKTFWRGSFLVHMELSNWANLKDHWATCTFSSISFNFYTEPVRDYFRMILILHHILLAHVSLAVVSNLMQTAVDNSSIMWY